MADLRSERSKQSVLVCVDADERRRVTRVSIGTEACGFPVGSCPFNEFAAVSSFVAT